MPPASDSRHYATAEEIQRRRPHWMIQFGVYTRGFWAFPLFDTTVRVCLHSADPADLISQMDAAEQQYRTPPAQRRRRARPERTDR